MIQKISPKKSWGRKWENCIILESSLNLLCSASMFLQYQKLCTKLVHSAVLEHLCVISLHSGALYSLPVFTLGILSWQWWSRLGALLSFPHFISISIAFWVQLHLAVHHHGSGHWPWRLTQTSSTAFQPWVSHNESHSPVLRRWK